MAAANYARFTEESNALDYLEKTVSFIKTARNNPQDWKWVILAVHGALYGFMVSTLKGTDPNNVRDATKPGKHFKLIGFAKALEECQDSGRMAISGFTKVLQLSEKQKQALNRIHKEFRNQFLHYRPALWSIEVSGFPEIIGNGLDVLRAVALEMGGYFAHYDRRYVAKLIAQAKEMLQNGSKAHRPAP